MDWEGLATCFRFLEFWDRVQVGPKNGNFRRKFTCKCVSQKVKLFIRRSWKSIEKNSAKSNGHDFPFRDRVFQPISIRILLKFSNLRYKVRELRRPRLPPQNSIFLQFVQTSDIWFLYDNLIALKTPRVSSPLSTEDWARARLENRGNDLKILAENCAN